MNWMKSIVLLLAVAFAACTGGADYGKDYGAPKAVDGKDIPKEPRFFSGDTVTLLPEVKPVPAGAEHHVRLDVNHKVVEVADGVKMALWPFGDDVPGPVIHIRQGDKVIFTLTNRSTEGVTFVPPMPHSIDFHAAMVSPQDKYRTIVPGQTLTFEWVANYPGVFMYHCATSMVLQHLAMGMYGMTIVEPKGGYPTKVDREYAIVQSEFYPADKPGEDGIYQTDIAAVEMKHPKYVVFNGRVNRHLNEPLKAKAGERVRLYVLNAGPNDTSSFHVIGTIFDRVWFEGNPANEMRGLQTVLLGASSGAIVEFIIPEPGKYILVDHEFADAHHGALGAIDATE
ncbi:MAG: multicopper oxidase domain-containing protein [Deltaproteobacteria bacterium]|nr:multicopper oxidase domain-containing protein [Deltaproteobacteria bacterium]